MVFGEPDWERRKFIPIKFYDLRNPEHAKTDEDYMRITMVEEDAEKIKDLEHMTLTMPEMKRLPQDLDDEEEEDLTVWEYKKHMYRKDKKPE